MLRLRFDWSNDPHPLIQPHGALKRCEDEFHLLLALAAHALGEPAVAATHLARTLAFSNSDRRAADLARELSLAGTPVVRSAVG